MKRTHERLFSRIAFRMPIEVWPHGKLKGLKDMAMSENLSSNSISFVTNLPLGVGNRIDMIFVMPRELTDRAVTTFRYAGIILRVHPVEGQEGKYQVVSNLLWLSDLGLRMSERELKGTDCRNTA
jgi:hypothetical protein